MYLRNNGGASSLLQNAIEKVKAPKKPTITYTLTHNNYHTEPIASATTLCIMCVVFVCILCFMLRQIVGDLRDIRRKGCAWGFLNHLS